VTVISNGQKVAAKSVCTGIARFENVPTGEIEVTVFSPNGEQWRYAPETATNQYNKHLVDGRLAKVTKTLEANKLVRFRIVKKEG
jgi:hypothetical protein